MVKPVFKARGTKSSPSYSIEVEAGEKIFSEGDLGTDMFIIQEGKVEILKGVEGAEKSLALLEKGDFFGEMSILEDMPRAASAVAKESVKLLQINGSTFDQMLRRNPEIAVRMMRKLSRRLRETDRLLRATQGDDEVAADPEIPTPQVPATRFGPERLIHDPSGMEFYLAEGDETTIGRRDPVTGIHPGIDLTPVDSQRSISRRHSKIFRRGERYFVREEIGTMNGTFVNGVRVETGVPSEFKDGDEVRFGLVKCYFHQQPS